MCTRRRKAVYEQRATTCMRSLTGIWECYRAAANVSAARTQLMSRRISDLKKIHQLMAHGVALNSNAYCHSSRRLDSLRKFGRDMLEREQEPNYTRLNRVAHLLSLTEAVALQEVAIIAQETDRGHVLVTCGQRLLSCLDDPSTAKACYVVAQCLNTSSRANDTIRLQSLLASKAATHSGDDGLMDASQLCQLVNLRHLIQKRSCEVGSTPDLYSSVCSLGVYQDFTTPILNRDIMKHLSTAQARILPFNHPGNESNSIVGLTSKVSFDEAAEVLREFAKECLSVVQVLRGCRQMMLALYVAYAADSLVQLLFSDRANCGLVTVFNKTISKHFDELSSQLLVRIMTANRPDVPDMALAKSCLLILGPKEGHKYLGISNDHSFDHVTQIMLRICSDSNVSTTE